MTELVSIIGTYPEASTFVNGLRSRLLEEITHQGHGLESLAKHMTLPVERVRDIFEGKAPLTVRSLFMFAKALNLEVQVLLEKQEDHNGKKQNETETEKKETG